MIIMLCTIQSGTLDGCVLRWSSREGYLDNELNGGLDPILAAGAVGLRRRQSVMFLFKPPLPWLIAWGYMDGGRN